MAAVDTAGAITLRDAGAAAGRHSTPPERDRYGLVDDAPPTCPEYSSSTELPEG